MGLFDFLNPGNQPWAVQARQSGQLRQDLENAIYAGRPDIAQQLLVDHFTKTGHPEVLQDPMVQNALANIPRQTVAPSTGGGMTIPQGMGGGNAYEVAGAGVQRPQPQGGALGGLEVFNQPNVGKTWDVNKGIGPEYLNQSQFNAKTLSGSTLPQQLHAAGAFPSTYAGQDVQSDYFGGPMGPLQTQRLGREQQQTQADIASKQASSAASKASTAKSLLEIQQMPEELKLKQSAAENQALTASRQTPGEMAADVISKKYPNDPAMQLRALTEFQKSNASTVTIDNRPVPPSLLDSSLKLENMKSLAEKAARKFDPDFVGWFDGGKIHKWIETYTGLTNSQQKASFRMSIDQLYQEIYMLSGAAFGEAEAKPLENFQPRSNQDDQTFIYNMSAFIDDLNTRIDNIDKVAKKYGFMTSDIVDEIRKQKSSPTTDSTVTPEAAAAELRQREAANAKTNK